MNLFKKHYQVKPNTSGFLFRNNIFEEKLGPGYHLVWDPKNRTELYCLPETGKFLTVTNQEVLTKDNIALRFSFNLVYKITDGQKLLTMFPLDRSISLIITEAEQRIYNIAQIALRNRISEMDSETLNEKRAELLDFKTDEMEKQASEFGVSIIQAQLRDITFPKAIQDLFAKHLESKIRSKSELENARTIVSTARALKNASEMMKDDETLVSG